MKSSRRRNRSIRTFVRSLRLGLELLEPRLPLALDVPAFSSLPGANHTIYLDFNGHTTTGTSWNNSPNPSTFTSPAYTTDADAANFSASELLAIENSWKRVAEDFTPFNVNVTTVEPPLSDLIKSGTGDTRWGVRVVVTKDVAFNCGCGGIAYINSFNWNSDTPVFVFNTGTVGVAEAASHEVGHALGLSHDGTATAGYYSGHGTGATSWSSIMGVGYYVNVSQWDKGEYFGSNNAGAGANYNKGPDDLNIITTYNGFGYRADDHGNTDATSSLLSLSGTSVSGSGIIERSTDVDVFRFTTGAGNVTLNINPISAGANLDIKADLVDSSGTVVATSNPATALNASFNLTLAAGEYFVRLDGTGVGDPTLSPPTGYTDYASLGQYTITGNIVASTNASLSVAATDAAKAEGNSGSTPFTFTVTRSGNLADTSTVSWAVTGSGASAASASDFSGAVLPSGTLQFNPNETSQTITINVAGDTTQEDDEGFTVTLSNASSGTDIGGATASGTIQNDDAPPAPPVFNISATDANKAEGSGGGSTPFVFTITRTGNSSAAATVKYTVSGATSKKASASDFVGGFPSQVLVNFAAGQTTADITLNVNADSAKENNEGFKVTLSNPVGATIGTKVAQGLILNDDVTGAALNKNEPDDDGTGLIAVADPLWMFMPAEMLTPEQLAVPVITYINGVPFIGDLAHDHDEHHDEHDDLIETDLHRETRELLWISDLVSSSLELSADLDETDDRKDELPITRYWLAASSRAFTLATIDDSIDTLDELDLDLSEDLDELNHLWAEWEA